MVTAEKSVLVFGVSKYIQNELRPTIGYVYENGDELVIMVHLYYVRNHYISFEGGDTFGGNILI
jgi:hypothetical protein